MQQHTTCIFSDKYGTLWHQGLHFDGLLTVPLPVRTRVLFVSGILASHSWLRVFFFSFLQIIYLHKCYGNKDEVELYLDTISLCAQHLNMISNTSRCMSIRFRDKRPCCDLKRGCISSPHQKHFIQYDRANMELDNCVDVNFHLLFKGIRRQ
jgi:hypothetical protein